MYDTTDTWFDMNVIEDELGDYLTIEARQGEHTTGAAVAIPMDAAPFLAHSLLDLWCSDDCDDDEEELGEDGWPVEDD